MIHVDPTIVDAVKTQKEARRTSDRQYVERPALTLVVHSFNRISNLDQLHQGLRSLGPHELVVCDDGSLDGSHQRWLELLNRPNDFLIHSNDLHEIRATDRAIRLANGELVCLVQDDDQIPTDDGWLDEVLAEFSADPALAIVGGFMGFDSFHPDPARARPVWGSGDFRFVHHVNIGPYFLRRRVYEKLGGWDHSFSAPGEPGICFDSELCLRAWLEGFRVGYRFVPFKGPAGHYAMDGGTVLFSAADRERNRLSNAARIYRRYAPDEAHIDEMVSHANSSMAERVSLPDSLSRSHSRAKPSAT